MAASLPGDAWRRWIGALPGLAERFLDHWDLRPDGPAAHGVVALVLPVLRPDGTPAVLKLQPVDEETRGEPLALRAWGNRHAVDLLDHDPGTGTMLLERLDASRSLETVPDDIRALRDLSELLAHLVATPAPQGLPRLADLARALLDRLPRGADRLTDPDERRLLATCAAATREVLDEPGDRLLHWDLHYANVLAPLPGSPTRGRAGWVAIDPKPLAGDPCFELLPALYNRWDDVTRTGDVSAAVRRRFHLMTEVLGLDRRRATAWTLARVLQNALWHIKDGATSLDGPQAAIARALLSS
ncbi:aminoglycoside phosphotransferase family protein [Streptomyces sp. TRM76323]|uniref:Aminoglycoside phosphotransferase family protein n=1 Tax=Streptomyces tamarix TaxID=3078565 RepID=A0ABU3QJ87_9ACTN|nr:aminoglycoside phosphotransferase family protein [Streptomyces tamarix]MDT9682802.1 aminoglycoside phosphotransferase family protein [Streptomyces tamarix]